MPIDFPTVKYGDPTTFPPSTPAATDTVMARTSAGADRNFALGNLAGIAPVAVADDQALAVIGGNWAAYTLTAQARSLLAASNQADQRAAIGAVSLTTTETIGGAKTFTATSRWNLGTVGSIQYGTPGAFPGITFRYGDPNSGDDSAYRSDIRAQTGRMGFFTNATMGNTSGAGGFFFTTTALAPNVTTTMTLGAATALWTTVYAQNATINTSDARLKTEPRQLRDAEFKAASAIARLPAVWRWLNRVHGDENCEPEGREARKHFGPTVQAAIAVMEANGLDPFAYSFICYDEWEAQEEQWHEWPAKDAVLDDDGNVLEPDIEAGRELIQPAREAGDRYSFRKEELLCFIVRALAQEIDGLAERVAALEAKV